MARLDAESQARRAKVEEDFDIAQRARRAEAARAEEERERVSTEAARQRIAAAEQHAAQLVAEAEAKAEAIRGVRDELTGRLLQARQLLTTLPDLERPAAAAAPRRAASPGPCQPQPTARGGSRCAGRSQPRRPAGRSGVRSAAAPTPHRPHAAGSPARAAGGPRRGRGRRGPAAHPVRRARHPPAADAAPRGTPAAPPRPPSVRRPRRSTSRPARGVTELCRSRAARVSPIPVDAGCRFALVAAVCGASSAPWACRPRVGG